MTSEDISAAGEKGYISQTEGKGIVSLWPVNIVSQCSGSSKETCVAGGEGKQIREVLFGKGRSKHHPYISPYQIPAACLRAYTGQSPGNLNQNLPKKKKEAVIGLRWG